MLSVEETEKCIKVRGKINSHHRKKYSHNLEDIREVGYLHGCTGTTGVFRSPNKLTSDFRLTGQRYTASSETQTEAHCRAQRCVHWFLCLFIKYFIFFSTFYVPSTFQVLYSTNLPKAGTTLFRYRSGGEVKKSAHKSHTSSSRAQSPRHKPPQVTSPLSREKRSTIWKDPYA